MKRFGNTSDKINVILSVFQDGEKLKGQEIANRVKTQGYKIRANHLNMFIYYNMLYKHLQREKVKGTNYYFVHRNFTRV
ncbi:MAG: hypothetical protein ACE5G7_00885 [Candidatus Hydrothermarchaeaceae archaeon]